MCPTFTSKSRALFKSPAPLIRTRQYLPVPGCVYRLNRFSLVLGRLSDVSSSFTVLSRLPRLSPALSLSRTSPGSSFFTLASLSRESPLHNSSHSLTSASRRTPQESSLSLLFTEPPLLNSFSFFLWQLVSSSLCHAGGRAGQPSQDVSSIFRSPPSVMSCPLYQHLALPVLSLLLLDCACRKGGNNILYAIDEDDSENEESADNEEDLQAWCVCWKKVKMSSGKR